jgi:formate transporter
MWTQLATSPAAYGGLIWPTFFLSLIPVTIGNIIGGGALVGGVYYFIYLRKR